MSEEGGDFVVVGGGIAGVSCAETLSNIIGGSNVVVVTASNVVKQVTNVNQITGRLASFDVDEVDREAFQSKAKGISVIHDTMTRVDHESREVLTESGRRLKFKKLCLCTGAAPKVTFPCNPFVLGIRDTESVRNFRERLKESRRIVIVGNGGIATELVYELKQVDIVWAIKDASITKSFVDPGAAEFFMSRLEQEAEVEQQPIKRFKYTTDSTGKKKTAKLGSAMGPDWHREIEVKGLSSGPKTVLVQYECEVDKILTAAEFSALDKESTDMTGRGVRTKDRWNIYVSLTNGSIFGCDFVVSATGVVPNGKGIHPELQLDADEAIIVDDNMQTNLSDVFAAGDVCKAGWEPAKHWFQMRLWTQARHMGQFAAQCMMTSSNGPRRELDFGFEMFTHVTKFFGHKVILLGLFNAQGLGEDHELLLRTTKNREYVKAVMQRGRMQGAVLIGETDLEETFENLILNQMDLSSFGEDLLDPDVDIEDFFD